VRRTKHGTISNSHTLGRMIPTVIWPVRPDRALARRMPAWQCVYRRNICEACDRGRASAAVSARENPKTVADGSDGCGRGDLPDDIRRDRAIEWRALSKERRAQPETPDGPRSALKRLAESRSTAVESAGFWRPTPIVRLQLVRVRPKLAQIAARLPREKFRRSLPLLGEDGPAGVPSNTSCVTHGAICDDDENYTLRSSGLAVLAPYGFAAAERTSAVSREPWCLYVTPNNTRDSRFGIKWGVHMHAVLADRPILDSPVRASCSQSLIDVVGDRMFAGATTAGRSAA